jgi:hypothetical protein
MTAWPELVAAALVGTDRRPVAGDDPAVALLEEAAAWSAYRRAGRLATAGLPAPQPAPAESRTVVAPASGARLADLVSPESSVDRMLREVLLPELLQAVVDRELRVPPEVLPDLLDTGRAHPELRGLVMAAGGARAVWLAAQNPFWARLAATESTVESSSDRDWYEGTPGQRIAYLRSRRRVDPDAGRELLVADWPTLAPDERAALLDVLATGLGPADEELIEQALGDKRKEVRATAQHLAATLPGSAFNQRASDRTKECLTVTGRAVEVTPPAQCDTPMRRDGIEPKPPTGVGERAWWLEQVLARTPLGDWDPRMLSLSIADDWEPVVHHGLAQAAINERNGEWATALVDRLTPAEGRNRWNWIRPALLAALPVDELTRRLIDLLRADTDPGDGLTVAALLEHIPTPWPDDLGAAVLTGIAGAIREPRRWFDVDHVSRLAYLGLPPTRAAIVDQLADRLRLEQPDNRRIYSVERLAAVLHQRHDMIKELT